MFDNPLHGYLFAWAVLLAIPVCGIAFGMWLHSRRFKGGRDD